MATTSERAFACAIRQERWSPSFTRTPPILPTATGGVVLGINRQEMSLEEAFLTLTDEKVKGLEAADGD